MKKIIYSLFVIPVLLFSAIAHAGLTIEITEGMEGALPIAVVPFGWNGMGKQPPIDFAAVVAADLKRSGRFKTLPRKDMLTTPSNAAKVQFRNWRVLGQDNLVIGHAQETAPGKYIVNFQLFDTFRGEQLTGFSFPATRKELRGVAHRISDIIYESLTGEPGAFTTRIAYVTDKGKGEEKRYKLQIADADGYNPQSVITSREPLMSPAWSPDGLRIAYVSFENQGPAIYVQTLRSGKREKLASFPGINGAPAWSPDGSQLALTLSKDGNPDVYVMNLISRSLRRLTNSYAIDTEPTWSGDSKSIVFTSDRGGKPQLYRIPTNGGRAKRLTMEGDYNARGVVSPNGKSIALVHGNKGVYRIALLDLSSGTVRILTKGRLDESPSFAPNGSMILYGTNDGFQGVLSAVSVDGKVRQRLVFDSGDVREPVWSPY